MKNKILIFITVLICLICTTVNAESKTEYFKEWSSNSIYMYNLDETTLMMTLLTQSYATFRDGFVISGVDMENSTSIDQMTSYLKYVTANNEEKSISISNRAVIDITTSNDYIYVITILTDMSSTKIEKYDADFNKLAEKNIEDFNNIELVYECKLLNAHIIEYHENKIYIAKSLEDFLRLDKDLTTIESKQIMETQDEFCSAFENLCVTFSPANTENETERIYGYDKSGTKEVYAGAYMENGIEQLGFIRLIENDNIIFEKNFEIFFTECEYMITAQFIGDYIITYGSMLDSPMGTLDIFIIDLKGDIVQKLSDNLYIQGFAINQGNILTIGMQSDSNNLIDIGNQSEMCWKFSKYTLTTTNGGIKEEERIYYGGDITKFNDVVKTSDGGYLTVGQSSATDIEGITNKGTNDAIIVKYDEHNNVTWQKNYGGNSQDYFQRAVEVSDGYIAVGYSTSTDITGITNKGKEDAIVVKYDKNGNMIWQKNYGGSLSDYFYGITTVNEDFVVVGSTSSKDISDLTKTDETKSGLIVKFDKNGNIKTQQLYEYNDETEEELRKVIYNKGELIVLGQSSGKEYSETHGFDVYFNDGVLIKYNENLKLLWEQTNGQRKTASNYITFNDLIVDSDSNIIIASTFSYWSGEGCHKAYLFKYDSDGNLLFEKTYNSKQLTLYTGFYGIEECLDGGFILVGFAEGINNNAIIAKFDKRGNQEWTQEIEAVIFGTYNMTPTSPLVDIIELESNEFVAIGSDRQSNIDLGFIYRFKHENKVYMKPSTDGSYNVDLNNGKNQVIVTPDEGYELDDIVIKTTTGEKIKYYVENGKYYFDTNVDTIVKVTFKEKIENPNTITFLKLGFIALIVFGIYNLFLSKKIKIQRYS